MSKDLPVARGTRRPYRIHDRRVEAIQEKFDREPTGNELRALKELPLSAKSHLYDTSPKGKKIYWLLQEFENGKVDALEEAGKLLWEQTMSPPDFSRPSLTPASKPVYSFPPPVHSLPPPQCAPPPGNAISAQQRNPFVCSGKMLPFNIQNAPENSQPDLRQPGRSSETNVQRTVPQVIITLPRTKYTSAPPVEGYTNTISSVRSPYQPHPLEMKHIPQPQCQISSSTPPIIRRPSSPFKRSFDPPATTSHSSYSCIFSEEQRYVNGGDVEKWQARVIRDEGDREAKRRKV